MYKIFRLTKEGYLKDIGYTSYEKYIKADHVVLRLKKDYPKRNFIILRLY